MASAYSVGFEPTNRLAEERESIGRRFWINFRRTKAKFPFAEDELAACHCVSNRGARRKVRVVPLGSIAYFVLQFNFICRHDARARIY